MQKARLSIDRSRFTFFFIAVLIFSWMRVAVLVSICFNSDGLWDGGLWFRQAGLHRRLIQDLLKFLLIDFTCRCCDTYRNRIWEYNTKLKTMQTNTHNQTRENCQTHQQSVLSGFQTSEAELSTPHQSNQRRRSLQPELGLSFLWLSEDSCKNQKENTYNCFYFSIYTWRYSYDMTNTTEKYKIK